MQATRSMRVHALRRKWRACGCLIGCAATEDGDVMPRGQVETDQTAAPIFVVILTQEAADLVRLHPHNRILLRIEIDARVVNLYPDKILIQLFSVAQESLLRHKLEEPRLLRRVSKQSAFQDPAYFFALLEERDG